MDFFAIRITFSYTKSIHAFVLFSDCRQKLHPLSLSLSDTHNHKIFGTIGHVIVIVFIKGSLKVKKWAIRNYPNCSFLCDYIIAIYYKTTITGHLISEPIFMRKKKTWTPKHEHAFCFFCFLPPTVACEPHDTTVCILPTQTECKQYGNNCDVRHRCLLCFVSTAAVLPVLFAVVATLDMGDCMNILYRCTKKANVD